MDRTTFDEALARESTAFRAAVQGNLAADVPSCPGWTVADLVWHLGEVQWVWGRIVRERPADRGQIGENPERPADEQLVPWFRQSSEELIAALAEADDAEPAWSWSSRKDVGFARRRQAQEAAVHRWDAELAAGRPTPIEPALAADGVDELFEFFIDELDGEAQTIGLRSTDTPDEWLARTGDRALVVERGGGGGSRDADAGVRASASDILLLLWRRISADDVEVTGDRDKLDRFLARADLT